MGKIRIFTQEENDRIVQLYTTNEIGDKHQLGKLFNTSHIKIHEILLKNNIDLSNKLPHNKKYFNNITYDQFLTNFNSKLKNNHQFIAVCKNNNKQFLDYSNISGALSRHLLEIIPDIKIPSSFIRRKYAEETGNFWHEQYFNIIQTPIIVKEIINLDEIEQKIVNLYTTKEIPSTHKLGEMFNMGHKKISEILKKHNVVLNKKGRQDQGVNKILSDKYSKDFDTSNRRYVAICKSTNQVFNDYLNKSGALSGHINKLYPDVEIPSLYERKKQQNLNKKLWFENYFDIIDLDKEKTRSCKLCDWITTDIDNKTGCFENHINNNHETTLDNYLNKFPEDITFHKNYIKQKERENYLINNDNFVICKLCNEKLKVLTHSHLTTVHGITQKEYRLMFPNDDILSKTSKETFIKNYVSANLTMTPTWTSKPEIELKEFIENLGFEIEKSRNRKLLNGKEIDLIIPSLKLGIEYNGLYYHTEKMGKNSTYHLEKTKQCNQAGYSLIHIFEDEWIVNNTITKNKLKHILGVNDGIKIGARKCEIKLIKSNIKNKFLNENHIQGADSANIKLGAFYNNELVGVMTFNNQKNMTNSVKSINEYELNRFVIKEGYIISGLPSKMLKYFIRNYNPENIISFADRRWTLNENNNLYTKLGFKLTSITKPNYFYYNTKINKYKRFHKFGFGKNSLKRKFPHLDFSKTEKELMQELGYDRIWDCGLFKYELNLI